MDLVAEVVERRPSDSQLAVARSLPDNSKPVWVKGQWTLSASDYLSGERYQQEERKMFRQLPVPIGPSALLPQAGSFVCSDGYGVQVLLTRDREGVAHAFLNACRHRGTRLTTDQEVTKGRLVVCPYHAWSYDLTGKLVGVPREESFEAIDRQSMGLVPLPCREDAGLIWVTLDQTQPGDYSHLTPDLMTDLAAIGLADMHFFARGVHEVDANWKLAMDTFLEGYHVIRLHSQSLGDLFEDTAVAVDRFGLHMRQVSGRLNFNQTMVDDTEHSFKRLRKVITYVYNIFPNTVVICSPDYVNILVMMPQGPRRTRIENFMLTNEEPTTEKLRSKWERSLALTDRKAFVEDFWAAALNQQGLETGGTPELTLGGMERAMHLFHDSINDFLKR